VKYNELIDGEEMQSYFGDKYQKWAMELKSLTAKREISENDISDKSAEKKLLQTIKFSWLGFFLTLYWAAYHNSKQWLTIAIVFSSIGVIDTVFLNDQLAPILPLVLAVIYGMYGKSYLLAGKASEYSQTGAFSKPSWIRVIAALAIIIVPQAIAVYVVYEIIPYA